MLQRRTPAAAYFAAAPSWSRGSWAQPFLASDALDHRPGHALFRHVERTPWILAHAAQALGDVAHVEVVEAQIPGRELLPGDRRRHGCVGARAECVWSDRRRADGIAQVIDEYPALAPVLRRRRDESIGESAHQEIGNGPGEVLGLVPVERCANW